MQENCENKNNLIEHNNKPKYSPESINVFLACYDDYTPIIIKSYDEKTNMIEYYSSKKNISNKIDLITYRYIVERIARYNLVKLTDFKDKCEIHKNNHYICFCFTCKKHLCDECLKSGAHLNHLKNNLKEIEPIESGINIIEEIIKKNKFKYEKLRKELDKAIKKLNEKLKKEKIKIEKLLDAKTNEMNLKKTEKLEKNKKEYREKKNEIIRKCEEELKKAKNEYLGNTKEINNEFKSNEEILKIKYDRKKENLSMSYQTKINKLEYESNIEKLESLIKLDERYIVLINYIQRIILIQQM